MDIFNILENWKTARLRQLESATPEGRFPLTQGEELNQWKIAKREILREAERTVEKEYSILSNALKYYEKN